MIKQTRIVRISFLDAYRIFERSGRRKVLEPGARARQGHFGRLGGGPCLSAQDCAAQGGFPVSAAHDLVRCAGKKKPGRQTRLSMDPETRFREDPRRQRVECKRKRHGPEGDRQGRALAPEKQAPCCRAQRLRGAAFLAASAAVLATALKLASATSDACLTAF